MLPINANNESDRNGKQGHKNEFYTKNVDLKH